MRRACCYWDDPAKYYGGWKVLAVLITKAPCRPLYAGMRYLCLLQEQQATESTKGIRLVAILDLSAVNKASCNTRGFH